MSTWEEKFNELQSQHESLQHQNESIQNQYHAIQDKYNSLQYKNESMEKELQQLKQDKATTFNQIHHGMIMPPTRSIHATLLHYK